ncbi:hypothetical protein ABKN59_011689 [Abortiporus biennis]
MLRIPKSTNNVDGLISPSSYGARAFFLVHPPIMNWLQQTFSSSSHLSTYLPLHSNEPDSKPPLRLTIWRRYRLAFIGIFFTLTGMITLLFIFEAPSQLFHTSRVRFRDKPSLETETRLHHQSHDATLFSSALATSLTPRRNVSSSRWSPISIPTCTPDTAPYYAPCLAQRLKEAIYGEELLYPNFRLREPIFAPTRFKHDKQEWRKLIGGIRDRAHWCKEDGWICYSGQSGQNISSFDYGRWSPVITP